MLRNRRTGLLIIAGWVATAAPLTGLAEPPAWIATGAQGMVASDSPAASQAGLRILQQGGNAIDAAAATSFALGVTRPYSTGLGGGGFMLARFADGRLLMLDYRETAPAAASMALYAKAREADPDGPPPARYGPRAVAVPGTLAGWVHALSAHGSMPLAEVIEPARQLAAHGFEVDEHFLDATGTLRERLERWPNLRNACAYADRTYLGEDAPQAPGDRLVQPMLAALLNHIAEHGPDFFYYGPVAADLEFDAHRYGGVITIQDLADYRVRERAPLQGTYRNYHIITVPPPSSGGVALLQALGILEPFDLPTLAGRDPAAALHVRLEAMKHAFADRALWLGDPDFAAVPTDRLLSPDYLRWCAGRIRLDDTSPPCDYGSAAERYRQTGPVAPPPNDAGTSHFCVVDRWGNVVAATETINTTFGSLFAVDAFGLLLNNEMDDFCTELGAPNAFGLVQSERNAVAPGKRPLSSMTPTIVLKDDKPYLLIGASGGPRIITSVLSVLIYLTDYGYPPPQAMAGLRPHHQWQPDRVCFDEWPADDVWLPLQQRGHHLDDTPRTGIVQFILRRPHDWLGASDPRKGGQPAGY